MKISNLPQCERDQTSSSAATAVCSLYELFCWVIEQIMLLNSAEAHLASATLLSKLLSRPDLKEKHRKCQFRSLLALFSCCKISPLFLTDLKVRFWSTLKVKFLHKRQLFRVELARKNKIRTKSLLFSNFPQFFLHKVKTGMGL